jgi:dipeptide transport system permease protein
MLIPTFIGVTIVTFAFIRLIPGDPIEILAGERGIDPVRHAELLVQFGYDKPIWQQYLVYMGNLLQGDLGKSVVTKQPVVTEFFTLFPATVELSLCAIILAVVLGLPAGIVAGVRRGTIFDHGIMTVSLTGYSMPIFWWGLLLIILFSGTLGWTPVSGRISLLFYFEPVTGFMLIDRSWRRSPRRSSPARPARPCSRS